MATFFINRPIFAWVIAIIIMLVGLLSVTILPVAQFPTIALPQISIGVAYPGASAQTLADTVTQVIEQHMNGLDNLVYMSSTSQSSGQASLNLTFEAGTDADIAQVQVQNKLQAAMPLLPAIVQQFGVTVKKSSSSFLMVIGFVSSDDSMTDSEIADYVISNLQDSISRLPGVGDIQAFGAPHSMRIWFDPDKLSNYNLTIADVAAVIQGQNMQVSAGQFGGTPQVPGQQLNATITAQTQLQTVEEFRNILVRVNPDAADLRLGDVAEVQLGQEDYDMVARFNGNPSSGIAIYLATGANALDTANGINKYLDEVKEFFPPGLDVVFPYDTTPFVRLSIYEVIKTLCEAIVLVFLVMLVFLQNFRATLIPALAVPVVLLGTFGVMAAVGYSINTLTMFGMVLAIGLLVDDAIVVVENVERVMSEEKLSPKEAAIKSMGQITSALVGIAMVLSAVFVPMAFSAGATGAIFRQFSITIVSAMLLSVVVALVFTPALCATLLKPATGHDPLRRRGPFGWFNRAFDRSTKLYTASVGGLLKRWVRFVLIYAILLAGVVYLFDHIPSSFLPDEDQGIMMIEAQLPPGATQGRALEVLKQIENHFLDNEKEAVKSIFGVLGYSYSGTGQNMIAAYVSLKDWSERPTPDLKVEAIAARAAEKFQSIRDALVFPIIPPAVAELGNSSGFDLQLMDRANLGHEALMAARDQFLQLAQTQYYDRMTGVRHNGKSDEAQYKIEVDQAKAYAFGVNISDIHDLLQTAWGSYYLNDFMDKGRIKKVYLQARADARMLPEDFDKWYIRNSVGSLVPFGSLIVSGWEFGSPRIEHYNGLPSVEMVGEPPPGVSSGQAMLAAEEIARLLPEGIGYEWTGISLQERQAGDQAFFLYAISIVVVFLCLAALYESWSVPFAVLLVVPVGIIGVQAGAVLFSQANDVYFQVGFLTIIGLSAKNAILIVEFAKTLHENGMGLVEATVEACRLRLRPILMTSFAFILGVLPLATSTGAGSGGQNAIGIGVVGGMLTVTVLGVFFIPMFFVMVTRIFKRDGKKPV